MLRNTHRFRLFFGLVLAGSTGPAWSAVTVTPTRVRETRVVALTKADANESRFFDRSELEITLKLSGPEMQDATEYKMPTITEATDDTGASLLPKDKPFSGFQQVQRDTFGSSPKKPPTTDVEIRTNLATAARKATTLKSVKGSLQIRAGGEKKQVVVKDVKSLAGKSIEDPGAGGREDRRQGRAGQAQERQGTGGWRSPATNHRSRASRSSTRRERWSAMATAALVSAGRPSTAYRWKSRWTRACRSGSTWSSVSN